MALDSAIVASSTDMHLIEAQWVQSAPARSNNATQYVLHVTYQKISSTCAPCYSKCYCSFEANVRMNCALMLVLHYVPGLTVNVHLASQQVGTHSAT